MKKLMMSVAAIAACACGAFADYDYTYYATADFSKDPDCQNSCEKPETAGIYTNAIKKLLAIGSGKSGVLYFEDGDYDWGVVTNYTLSGANYIIGLDYTRENRTYSLKALSGNPEKCRFLGTGDRKVDHRLICCNRNNINLYLDGIQFTNFYGNGPIVYCAGNYNTLVDFTNCIFRANGTAASGGQGGCFYCPGASSKLVARDCTFEGNYAYFGGVLRGAGHAQRFETCRFTGNVATNVAGATRASGGVACYSGYFTNCIFNANIGQGDHEAGCGSVAYRNQDDPGTNPTFVDCVITNHKNSVRAVFRRCDLTRCYVADNSADYVLYSGRADGCIIRDHECGLGYSTPMDIRNCLFINNKRTGAKQALISASNASLVNCTFVGCAAVKDNNWQSALVCATGSKVTDCLFFDNECNREMGQDANSKMYATNCLYTVSAYVESKGCNKLTEKELDRLKAAFRGGNDDWTKYDVMDRHSPTVNAGVNPLGFTKDDKDLAGNRRFVGKAIDIGASECQIPDPGLMLYIR